MSKKILALLLVVLMVIGLAACSQSEPTNSPANDGDDKQQEENNTPDDNEGEDNETPDDNEGEDNEGGDAEVTGGPQAPSLLTKDESEAELVVPYYGYTDEAYDQKIETLEAEGTPDYKGADDDDVADYNLEVVDLMREYFPNYKVQYVAWGWSEELDQKNRAALTAGNPPSLLVGEVYAPNYAAEGVCSPIPQDLIDACYPSMLVLDGDGVPTMINTDTALFHVYINMDIYEECGYTEADFPKTWAEWQTQSEDITAQGAGEFWGGAIPTFPNAGGTLRTTPWLRQLGVDYGTADSVEMLSSDEAMKAFEFIRAMGPNLPKGVGDASTENDMWSLWDDGNGNGSVAFIVDGTFRDVNNRLDGMNYACIDLPVPDGVKDASANCAVGAVICGVPATAPYQDACMNLLRVITSEPVAEEWMEQSRAVPLKAAMENPYNYRFATDAFNKLCDNIKNGNALMPGLVAWQNNASSVWEIIGQKLTGPLTSSTTPIEDLVATVQSECTPLLAK